MSAFSSPPEQTKKRTAVRDEPLCALYLIFDTTRWVSPTAFTYLSLALSRSWRTEARGLSVFAGTGLAAHWCVDIQFSSCYPIKGHYHNSTERKFCQGYWRNFVRLHKCSIFEVGPQCALRTSTWNTLLLFCPLLIKNWERHFDNLFHTNFTLICRVV